VLVAVTVAVPAAAGAVKSPLVLMVPALEDHVTAELKLPVPCTLALHCEVAFSPIVDGLQVTAKEVIEELTDCTVTEAVPDFVASCVLVAVTVAVPAVAGAVKSPLVLMVPTLEDHVTAELKLPVPCTEAPHCEVAFIATAAGVHITETDEMDGVGAEDVLLPPLPPHANKLSCIPQTRSARRKGLGIVPPFRLCDEGLMQTCSFLEQEA